MKLRFLSVAFVILTPIILLSQVGLSPASPAITSQAKGSQSNQVVSLLGKVSTEDGSTVSDRVTIILQCGNDERGRAITDRAGEFSMTLNVAKDPDLPLTHQPMGSISPESWGQCELYGEAGGYQSERLRMTGTQDFGVIQVGTIVLHPLSKQPNGFVVSATSLAAPEKAKKAFEKGQEQEKKGKWAAARDYFKKAVEVYPRYALAWLELGRTQIKQNDFAEAQQSFHQATTEDPRCLEAFVQMAGLAVEQRQWKELADSTEHIVQLSPDSAPNYWFLNSAANFNLGNVTQAESSATRALRLDPNHKLPQVEYLYGMILARRGDYNSAVQHMQAYLRLSPHASDVADAQAKLADLQKLAASQKTANR